MIISCEKCGINFNLDEKLLQPTGSKVRCSKCNNIFTAYPPPVEKHEEAAEVSTPAAEPSQHKPEEDTTEPQGFKDEAVSESHKTEELKQDLPVEETVFEDEIGDLDIELEDKSKEDFEIDIDGMLDMEEKEIVGEAPPDNEFEDIDLELDLEKDIEKLPEPELEEDSGGLNLELDIDEDDSADTLKEEDLDDLEFELDLSLVDYDKQEESSESDEAQDKIVDLSDMEDVLELDVDEQETKRVFGEETAELELELFEDSEPEDEICTEGEYEENFSEESKADFTELEKMLDIEDLPAKKECFESEDDFVPEIILDENIIDENEEENKEISGKIVETESNIVEDIADNAPEKTDAGFSDTVVLETGEEKNAEPEKIKKKKEKKKISKPILILFIIILIAGGAYGIVLFLEGIGITVPFISGKITSGKGVYIPYVSDLVKPKEQDTEGKLNITPLNKTIEGKYFKNSTLGSVFVVTGQVRNDYDHPRSNIQIFAKIYAAGDLLLKKKKVYCGNIVKEDELKNLTKEEINKKFANKNNAKQSNLNLKVKPGKTVPFMAVFFNLPDNMKTFSVEVADSSK